MSKVFHRKLSEKMENLDGPEWNSSDEETEPSKIVKKVPKDKKTPSTKKSKTEESKNENVETGKDATVLYIGHIPSEFEERDLGNFLKQFGKVVNIRISRSIKSGNSRGYAFVRWEDAETARIVQDTLQGYFVGGRRLVCQSVPNPNKHMFFDTEKVIQNKKIKQKLIAKKRNEALSDASKMREISVRLVQRERKKREKLAELGIDYDFPGYEASHSDDIAAQDETPNPEIVTPPKEKKRKNSVENVASTPSSSSRKRKNSVDSESSEKRESKQKDSKSTKVPQSEKKPKKAKKSKTRRQSVP